REGSCDGGKSEHDRAVGHVTQNQLLDDHRGKSCLLDLHKQLEIRVRKKRERVIEGERVFDMKRWVVRHHQSLGVDRTAHVELDTSYSVVTGSTSERSKRVFIPTSRPSAMRDELHDEVHKDGSRAPRTAQGVLSAPTHLGIHFTASSAGMPCAALAYMSMILAQHLRRLSIGRSRVAGEARVARPSGTAA